MNLFLLFVASTIPGAIVGVLAFWYSQKIAVAWGRRLVQSAGVAAVITPYGVPFGPEGEGFFALSATAVFVLSLGLTALGKGGDLLRFAFGSTFSIALASIAILSIWSVWKAIRGMKHPRLLRALLIVLLVPVVTNYFITFVTTRTLSSEGSVPVGNRGWNFHVRAIAITYRHERLPLCRFLRDYDYQFQLRSTWIGSGLVPEAPIPTSIDLISEGTETPLTVVRDPVPRRTEKRDGRILVNRIALLSDGTSETNDPPQVGIPSWSQVKIPWWYRGVGLRLSFEDEGTESLIIPLHKRGRLVPTYSPLFAFGKR